MVRNDVEYGKVYGTGGTIPALKKMIYEASMCEATAATNGYHGGDSEHGSRTLVRIRCQGTAYFSVNPDPSGYTAEVTLNVEGDSELSALIEALKFCGEALQSLALPKTFA